MALGNTRETNQYIHYKDCLIINYMKCLLPFARKEIMLQIATPKKKKVKLLIAFTQVSLLNYEKIGEF